MSLINTVSRIAGGVAGGAARRRGTVPAARRPTGTGTGTGMGTGTRRGGRAGQAAAAGGMLSRFLRRR